MQFISNRSVLCKEVFGTPSVELRVSDKQMSMSPSIAMKKTGSVHVTLPNLKTVLRK